MYGAQGYRRIYELRKEVKELRKAVQEIKEEASAKPTKEAAVDKPADLPKNIAGKSIVHILSPSACWTMTVATTVPPDEQ